MIRPWFPSPPIPPRAAASGGAAPDDRVTGASASATAASPALWTAAEVRAALGLPEPAAGSDAWVARGVSINSRTLVPGDLFFALKGPTFDGHTFVAKALAAGAAAAVVSRPAADLPEPLPADLDPARLLVVPDPLAALTALGAAARARFCGRIVAVTGSVGKTGTKDMLTLALGGPKRVFATQGNLNNHIGAPLTLARMPADAPFAVLELGMNHPGEIAPLSRLVRPHVAIITAIAPAHLEHFPNLEAIADAKGEIMVGLEPGGTLILNQDNRFYERLCRASRALDEPCRVGRILGFGQHIAATARLLDCAVETRGTAVLALIGDQALSYRLGVEGRHWARNSLAVLAAVLALDLPLEPAAQALAAMTAPAGRGHRHTLRLPEGGEILVIDESYNANPDSMTAALVTLAQTATGRHGRRIAVLGDMLELGPLARAMHADLARTILEQGLDLVHTAGPLMTALAEALPPSRRGHHAEDADSLLPLVRADLRPGDVVMVKGSNGSRVNRIVAGLLIPPPGPPPTAGPPPNPAPAGPGDRPASDPDPDPAVP